MKASLVPVLAFAAIWLPACSSVVIQQPLAKATAEELREKLEGVWRAEDGAIHLAFNEAGEGEIAFVDRTEDEFRLVRGEVAAVSRDDRNFLSVRFEENGKMLEFYHLAEFVIDDSDNLIAWPAGVEPFKRAVENGTLQGTVKKGKYTEEVNLTSSSEDILGFLEANPHSVDTRSPVVLQKLD